MNENKCDRSTPFCVSDIVFLSNLRYNNYVKLDGYGFVEYAKSDVICIQFSYKSMGRVLKNAKKGDRDVRRKTKSGYIQL